MLDRYDQDLLLGYLEDELDADERAQLQAMLAEDPQLAILLNDIAQDRALLRSLPREDAPGDLVQDVTQTLERRMLLDESPIDAGPIPIGRGRGLAVEPASRSGWGRAFGLAGLAASVAIAAGIVVYFVPQDPLERTAEHLAESTPPQTTDQDVLESPTIASALEEETRDTDATAPTPAPPIAPEGIAEWPGTDDVETASDPSTLNGNTAPPVTIAEIEPTRGLTHNAIALSNTTPRQQLVLFSEEPDLTREQLVVHCIANGIPIVYADNTATLPDNIAVNETLNFKLKEEAALNNNYALLVNDRQLSELVADLNTNTLSRVDRKLKRQRAAFSTQLALVTELPQTHAEDARRLAERYASREKPQESHVADVVGEDIDALPVEDVELLTQQSLVELRLPEDLGSAYNNFQNRDNLVFEQRRSNQAYRQNQLAIAQTKPVTKALTPAPKPSAPDDKGEVLGINGSANIPDNDKAKSASDLVAGETSPKPGRAAPQKDNDDRAPIAPNTTPELSYNFENQPGAEADLEPKTEPAPDTPTDAPRTEPATPMLDPTRGNWLAPHLPLANTTLILNIPLDPASEPTQLVPIRFNRAAAEEVLIFRRQTNLSPDAPADDAAAEPDFAETAETTVPESVDAEPADADTAPAEPPANP